MARTIAEIQAQIIASVQADSTLSGSLTSTSATAIWRLWTFVFAAAIWIHEQVWERYRVDTLESVAALKPHTLRWYAQKALDFQLGRILPVGEDRYNNTGVTAAQIALEKIVKYAAANEQNGTLVVKVAKDVGAEITAPTVAELAAISDYLFQVKDAGVSLLVRGVPADYLRLTVDVYYDATVLSATGARLDGTSSTPVQDAVKAFLKAVPFDGRFIKNHLTDAMQAVEGVVSPVTRQCQARRHDDPSFQSVDEFYEPFSGFLRVYNNADLTLNFIAK
jgi:hypothetical protein